MRRGYAAREVVVAAAVRAFAALTAADSGALGRRL
jgi:hypothetical protein